METKKKRKAPFNIQELNILTDELLRLKGPLLGNVGERAQPPQRKEMWRDILAQVNAVASEERDLEDLHRRWQDLKLVVRKEDNELKRSMLKTSGGPYVTPLRGYKRTVLQILDAITLDGTGTADHGLGGSKTPTIAGSIAAGRQGDHPPAQEGGLPLSRATPVTPSASQVETSDSDRPGPSRRRKDKRQERRGDRAQGSPSRSKEVVVHQGPASPHLRRQKKKKASRSLDVSSDPGRLQSKNPANQASRPITPPPLANFRTVVAAAAAAPFSRSPSPPLHLAPMEKLPVRPMASGLSPLVADNTAGKRKRASFQKPVNKPTTAVVPGIHLTAGSASPLFTTMNSRRSNGKSFNNPPEMCAQPDQSQGREAQNLTGEGVFSGAEATVTYSSPDAQSASKHVRLTCIPWWADNGNVHDGHLEDPLRATTPPMVSTESLAAFRTQTEKWFQETQADRILRHGQTPAWFHRFTTRREADERLQNKPLGCFLVRFCESKVGLVLSYRSKERSRHFLLDQLPDERYVILGEEISHVRLEDLIEHYRIFPIEPYGELLASACTKYASGNADWPEMRQSTGEISDAPTAQINVPLQKGDHRPYTHVKKAKKPVALPVPISHPPDIPSSVQPPEDHPTNSQGEVPDFIPPLPARLHPTTESEAETRSTQCEVQPLGQARPNEGFIPVSKCTPQELSADNKYAFLVELHTYAEPKDCVPQEKHIYHDPQDTIDFYAMGRGSVSEEENIYSEVGQLQRKPSIRTLLENRKTTSTLPVTIPIARSNANKNSTLPPRSQREPYTTDPPLQHHPLSRNPSRQAFRAQASMTPPKPSISFDDPVYGREIEQPASGTHTAAENHYEQILEDRQKPMLFSTFCGR